MTSVNKIPRELHQRQTVPSRISAMHTDAYPSLLAFNQLLAISGFIRARISFGASFNIQVHVSLSNARGATAPASDVSRGIIAIREMIISSN